MSRDGTIRASKADKLLDEMAKKDAEAAKARVTPQPAPGGPKRTPNPEHDSGRAPAIVRRFLFRALRKALLERRPRGPVRRDVEQRSKAPPPANFKLPVDPAIDPILSEETPDPKLPRSIKAPKGTPGGLPPGA